MFKLQIYNVDTINKVDMMFETENLFEVFEKLWEWVNLRFEKNISLVLFQGNTIKKRYNLKIDYPELNRIAVDNQIAAPTVTDFQTELKRRGLKISTQALRKWIIKNLIKDDDYFQNDGKVIILSEIGLKKSFQKYIWKK